MAEGFGEHTVIVTPDQEYSYARLQKDANRIAHVLLDDCGLLPGNRVLLRAPIPIKYPPHTEFCRLTAKN